MKINRYFTLTLLLTNLLCFSVFADISGNVFRDYNANGVQDSNEPGVAGVTVTAYAADGSVAAVTTSKTDFLNPYTSAGTYVLAGLNAGQDYRVEFTNFPGSLKSGPVGKDSLSSVSVADGAQVLSFGLSNPAEYCPLDQDSGVYLATPCYVGGDPLLGGSAAHRAAFVKAHSTWTGIPASMGTVNTVTGTAPNPVHLAESGDVGSVWGVAYHRSAERILTSAVYKRHSGLGIGGLGGIYVIDPDAVDAPSLFVDLSTLGVSFGTDPRTISTDLPATHNAAHFDHEATPVVGKIGIGDIDLSEDGASLYVVNLFERSVVKADLGDSFTAPSSSSDITEFPLNLTTAPELTTTNTTNATPCPIPGGDPLQNIRPWGITIQDGTVYLGVVCSAESSQNRNDLHAYVFSLDETTGQYSLVEDFGLAFPRGAGYLASPGTISDWQPWYQDEFSVGIQISIFWANPGIQYVMEAAPTLSDLAFDEEGNLILAFSDLTGFKNGYIHKPLASVPNASIAAGDILKSCLDINGEYQLENDGSCGSDTGFSQTVSPFGATGPGGGEFFDNIWSWNTNLVNSHGDTSFGAIAYHAGLEQFYMTSMNPTEHINASGGFLTLDSYNGSELNDYTLYRGWGFGNSEFGKATGVGDLEMICDPAPIEIGNKVWFDINQDGVQDPNEPGFEGVILDLYELDSQGNKTFVCSTVTDVDGLYLFGPNSVDSKGQPAACIVDTQTDYQVEINPSNFEADQVLFNHTLTVLNSDSDIRDNDGSKTGTVSGVVLRTGFHGDNNHTYDFGLIISNTLSNLQSEMDGNAFDLYQRGIAAANWRRGDSGDSCKKVGKKKIKKKKRQMRNLYQELWSDVWQGFSPTYFSFSSTAPAHCTLIDYQSNANEISADAKKLQRIANAQVNKKCRAKSKRARKLKRLIKKQFDKVIDSLDLLPQGYTCS